MCRCLLKKIFRAACWAGCPGRRCRGIATPMSTGLLNAGLLLRAIGEPLVAVQPARAAAWLLAASALLQLLAGWALVANT
jgi:hypothetical protein